MGSHAAGLSVGTALPPGWWWAEPGRLLVGRHPARAVREGLDPWAVLAAAGVSRVLTLVEPAEEDGLPRAVPPAGFRLERFPIPDFDVPGERALVEWVQSAGRELGSTAAPLFLHCMGGCGRSGVMAAALLLEWGLCPASALQERLDQRRMEAGLAPGCPETVRQRELVGRLGELLGIGA